MDADENKLNSLSQVILGCAYKVSNELGTGFLEKVYENAMMVELTEAGLKVRQQVPITVRYHGFVVGEYFADLLVEDCIIIELKCCEGFDDAHLAQCLNYLKATGIKLCLLINFGKTRVEVKRLVRGL
jgi:GxxExxY protein